jgi:hypothetical protein
MKQVYLAENPIEAHMVADLLEAEGIAAAVQGEHLFAIRGAVPISYPTVWVLDEDDYGRARELALNYDRGQYDVQGGGGLPHKPWTCAQCGERIEGHFDACWQCGADRPVEDDASRS